jgi:hypothetical protein
MDDLLDSISEKAAWPMIHVFVPAVVAIYAKNIWIMLSVIYIFESIEYMVSLLPEMEYWGDVGANALISDIIMGLTGYWLITIIGETEYNTDNKPWYAFLKPVDGSCYKKVVPYLHTILAAASSGIASISVMTDILPEDSPYEFIYFGITFTLFAILFGKDRFAAHAFILIILISTIAIFTGYTFFVSFGVVFTYYLFNKWTKSLKVSPKDHEYTAVKNSNITTTELLF